MKKVLGLAMVLGLVLLTGVAFAADTNTLTVQANIVGTCKFSTATSTLNFGALDPSSASDASASTTVNFWCTKNASYTVTDNNGSNYLAPNRRMKDAGTDYIPYGLTYSPATGSGSGKTTPITLTLTGTVVNANYVNAPVGNYSDTVILSIAP